MVLVQGYVSSSILGAATVGSRNVQSHGADYPEICLLIQAISAGPAKHSEWCACKWVNKCYEWVYNLLLYYCVSGIRNIWRFVNRASLSALTSERYIFVTFCFCHCSQDSLITEPTHSPVGLCEFVKRISNCFIPIKRTNVYIFSFQNSRNFLVLIV